MVAVQTSLKRGKSEPWKSSIYSVR